MLDSLRSFLSDLSGPEPHIPEVLDSKLCAAALMVHVIVADGIVSESELMALHSVLERHYSLTKDEAAELARQAREEQESSIDLFRFTSVVKTQMSEGERAGVIEDLWLMVYADGVLHEFEDNLVWRIAELIAVSRDVRMALKRKVRGEAGLN